MSHRDEPPGRWAYAAAAIRGFMASLLVAGYYLLTEIAKLYMGPNGSLVIIALTGIVIGLGSEWLRRRGM